MEKNNKPIITSKIEELEYEIQDLKKTIRLLKEKLDYHKLG